MGVMYPLHLENEAEKLYVKVFSDFAKRLRRELAKRLKTAFPDERHDGAAVRADDANDDIFSFLESLREEVGDWIDNDELESRIAHNVHLLDAWSRDKTMESLRGLAERLNTPQPPSVTGRLTPGGQAGELWLMTVNLKTGITDAFVGRTIKKNLELIKSLESRHFDDVADIISAGYMQGRSYRDIADQIEHITGVNRSKAKFWARDQASKFFGAVTKERQTAAGIPGYVWRTVRDGRVRDKHAAVTVKDRYFEWSKPPAAGVRGNNVHPGEDFNCRCWAEPAFGPEPALGFEPEESETADPLSYMRQVEPLALAKTIREAEAFVRSGNYADNVSFRGVKKANIAVINEWNSGLKAAIEDFPVLRKNMIFTGTIQEHYLFASKQGYKPKRVGKSYAASILNAGIMGISVNRQWVNSGKFYDSLRRDVALKYHPVGCDTIKSIIDHEMTHQLTDLLQLDKDPRILYIWNSYGDKSLITKELSQYAWKNDNENPIREFISEAFSEYRNNSECRPLARQIGEIIMDSYRRYKAL